MHRLRYQITACAPLVLSTISGEMNMTATKKYIPGISVLGILAQRFIQHQKNVRNGHPAHEDDDFYNWFLAGRVKFSNAYILSHDEYGKHTYYPTPFSIEKEKYGSSRNAYDLLWIKEELSEPTQAIGDFCLLTDHTLQVQSVETCINFHHARDRDKGVSKEGMIFNYESINAGQVFEGDLRGEASDLKRLKQICGDSQWTAFAGRSRSAQYGTVEFTFVDKEPVRVINQLSWPSPPKENSTKLISMTLLSKLILYNEYGYPTVDVSNLQWALEQRFGTVEIKKAFVKQVEIENFVGVWRLKKPSETCFEAGSTFLLRIDPSRIEHLIEIEQSGLGERTNEGFSRCMFGLQIHETLRISPTDRAVGHRAQKPQGEIPEMAKKIIKTMVQDAITESFELKAIQKLGHFSDHPSNALIAKLHEMVKQADSKDKFVANVKGLREIATKQLKRCVSRDHNLKEFLGSFEVNWKAFFEIVKHDKLKLLCGEIGYKPQNDTNFEHDLYKRYLTTFFTMMRKRAIAKREGYDVE